MTKKENKELKKNIVQGSIGAVAGACLGVTGLGLCLGLAHANKDKIEKFYKKNRFT